MQEQLQKVSPQFKALLMSRHSQGVESSIASNKKLVTDQINDLFNPILKSGLSEVCHRKNCSPHNLLKNSLPTQLALSEVRHYLQEKKYFSEAFAPVIEKELLERFKFKATDKMSETEKKELKEKIHKQIFAEQIQFVAYLDNALEVLTESTHSLTEQQASVPKTKLKR